MLSEEKMLKIWLVEWGAGGGVDARVGVGGEEIGAALILTSPSSVVSPVYSPANQQIMKSGKNVRTPPPHGQFGGKLVPCGAIQSLENYINH
jgi:hypothetical protein